MIVAAQQPSGRSEQLKIFRSLAQTGQVDEAYRILAQKFEEEKRDDEKAKIAVALGINSYNQKKYEEAKVHLEQAIQLKTHLEDYAHFYLGLVAKEVGDFKKADGHFEAVRKHQPPSIHNVAAAHELLHIAISQKKLLEAHSLAFWLERKGRRTPLYPEILKDLMRIAIARNRRWESCRWAQKLYTKYAADTLSMGWGSNLAKAPFEDKPLGCAASPRDLDRRYKSLLIAGEYEQAKLELDEQGARFGGSPKHAVLRGNILLKYGQLDLAQGQVPESIKKFNEARQLLGPSFTIHMLLAKAYSRTDDYLHAIDNYLKAYRNRPGSKLGRTALFQAAFLSYQNRDYDGASRRFEEFIRKYRRSSMAYDSKWHLAWIRYLKSDFEGALKDFERLSRKAKGTDLEKITYWKAMSYLRLGQTSTARLLFDLLSKQRRLGYYTAAARSRLATLSEAPAGVPLGLVELKNLIPKSLMATAVDFSIPKQTQALISKAASATDVATAQASPGEGERKPQGDEGEGFDDKDKDEDVDSEKLGGTKEPTDEDEAEEEEKEAEASAEPAPSPEPAEVVMVTPFKDRLLQKRFDKSTQLLDLGFDDWAKMELREIEKRTSNKTYLQSLMTEYIKAGDFHRGAFIADVVFQGVREKGGLQSALSYWTAAFPQAFSKQVVPIGKRFDVPVSLIWGIMRSESGYRTDVHSGAGALGLMQMIPSTAHQVAKFMGIQNFKAQDLLSPEPNILFCTWYLKRLNKLFENNLPLSIAGYNAGPHRVQGWLKDFGHLEMDEFVEHIPYLETRNYTKKVLRHIYIYRIIYERELNPLVYLAQRASIKFEGPKPQKENWDPI